MLLILSSCVGVFIALVVVSKAGSRGRRMPPGPPTFPIVGNAITLPREKLHLQFSEWAKIYGDIYSLKIFNHSIIVLNSPTQVRQVLEKQSAASSNRPKSVIADMITPKNMNMGTGRFANATWRAMRKAANHLLNKDNVDRLSEYQHAEAAQLMRDICTDPKNWYDHIRRYTTSFSLGVVYGQRGPTLDSPNVADFLHVHPRFMAALEIGTAPPVDILPFLKYVPERFAQWKTEAKEIKRLHEALFGRLLSGVETRLKAGLPARSLMSEAVTRAQDWGLDRDLILHLGGTLLEASDTFSGELQFAVYILVNFPDVQRKAIEELDRVVGRNRAPRWDDLGNLPYIKAVVEEVLRFRPIGPLGLPHELSADLEVDGYTLPKDSIIFANIYGMFHDARFFDNPEDFIPERFLEHPYGVKNNIIDDPARRPNMVFGAGRRVCPGLALAKATLEINLANFVWAFEFLPGVDSASGRKLYPNLNEYSPGITATPFNLPVQIIPRSDEHVHIIQEQFSSLSVTLSLYENP